jgi:hypothetical protein
MRAGSSESRATGRRRQARIASAIVEGYRQTPQSADELCHADERLHALPRRGILVSTRDEALASYQAEYGDVTEEKMASQVRRDREGARGGCPPLK